MSGQTYFERNDRRIAQVRARGGCAEPGPWATVCTEDAFHRYSHYDAQEGDSWQDDWRDGGSRYSDPDAREWLPQDGDSRCQACGFRNPVWWATNEDWNRIMPGDGILCPSCYHERWLLSADSDATVPTGDEQR